MFGPQPNGNFFEHFAALLGNLLTISYGFMFGITAPTLILYKSEQSPLSNGPLSDEEISWITAYLYLGGIAGAVFFKHLSDSFGRRATLLLIGLVQNLGWFGVTFGYSFNHICISRLMVGLSGGGALTILPIYLTEISKNLNSRFPHAITLVYQSMGIFVGYIIGTFVEYITGSLVGLVISVLFSLCFAFVQESPYHYLKQNNMQLLEKALRYFRAIRDLDQREDPEFQAELGKFKRLQKELSGNLNGNITSQPNISRNFTMCETLRAFLACLVLIITSQLSGVFVILNYSSIIFEDIGSILPGNYSSICLGMAMFIGSLVGIGVAKITWRKCTAAFCSLLNGASLAVLGCFLQRKYLGYDVSDMEWIPLACLGTFILISSASIYPLTFIIIAELFPQKSVGILNTFYYVLYWTIGLLLIKYHFGIIAAIGMHIYVWGFAGACIIQFTFIAFILPSKS